MTPVFLTLGEAFAIHANQIEQYGGEPGLRDEGLLRSALAQPEASFGGEWLHTTLAEMAGAYLFHLVKNHAFVDGNKRTAHRRRCPSRASSRAARARRGLATGRRA
jgi:death-on-curing protein